ncbi:SDR family oxidoreductase [Kocuria rosea]|uniref:SDR family oxidoreductase n=1 Tax=Kocuria rosea TaxID=1275 RepID=UPI002040DAEA|nr:SDR family oxidoreductase [Kocuria rosea]MCM3689234.1 SDR family oxidoreductase [Kocuria rosea]
MKQAMKQTMQLRPISEQVVVVLGASSGIGRESTLRLAGRGAKLVVAARSEPALQSLVAEITALGAEGAYVVCDVVDHAQVEAVAETAVRTFGRIDTWVNVAAVLVHASFEETLPEEFRRLMEINYLGQVHGALAALPRLREAGGGALIAVSSVESMVSLPRHSAYSASKHAVEGVIDGLRRDLLADGVPISVTSIKPGTINTPFFTNAAHTMDVEPTGAPPIYQPAVVADCVLHAAEHPVRDLYAGGAARLMTAGQMLAPRLMDALLARIVPLERSTEPAPGGAPGTLYSPREQEDRAEGDFGSRARRFSAYTWVQTHPRVKPLLAGGALAAVAAALGRRDGS